MKGERTTLAIRMFNMHHQFVGTHEVETYRYGEWHVHGYRGGYKVSHASGLALYEFRSSPRAHACARALSAAPPCPYPLEDVPVLMRQQPYPLPAHTWGETVRSIALTYILRDQKVKR